jgi:GNAT superfamily N-acetyltransferase
MTPTNWSVGLCEPADVVPASTLLAQQGASVAGSHREIDLRRVIRASLPQDAPSLVLVARSEPTHAVLGAVLLLRSRRGFWGSWLLRHPRLAASLLGRQVQRRIRRSAERGPLAELPVVTPLPGCLFEPEWNRSLDPVVVFVAVRPEARGDGVASGLYLAMNTEARRRWRAARILARVDLANPASLRFHTREGWCLHGTGPSVVAHLELP